MPRIRVALFATFAADGAAYGLWVAHLPALRERFDLSPASLAALLFALSLGSIGGTLVGTAAMRAAGESRVLRASLPCAAVLAAVVLLAPSFATALALAALFGISLGVTEVAMNALGALAERALARAWMSSFHGMWSLGFFAAAAASATLLARAGASVTVPAGAILAFAIAGAVGVVAIAPHDAAGDDGRAALVAPRGAVATLAAIVTLGWLGEGALTDWAPVFAVVVSRESAAAAAAISAAYGTAMTVARFAGDALVRWFGARTVLFASVSIAACAVAAATSFPSYPMELVAFTVGGLGIANLSPLVFAFGGRYGSAAVGRLTSLGYVAFLSGPPLLGALAHIAGLRVAFALPIVALAASALATTRLRSPG